MKHNRIPRVAFDGQVALLVGDEGREGKARDLSTGGIFVEAVEPRPPIDAEVGLGFSLPDGAFVEGDARVVRAVAPGDDSERPGVALRFERFTGPGKQRIREYISLQTRPPRERTVPVRVRIGDQLMRADAGKVEDGVLQLECPLPFLQLGTCVELLGDGAQPGDVPQGGSLRWVSIHVPPGTTTPRIKLGVSLPDADARGTVVQQPSKAPASSLAEEEPVMISEGPHVRIPLDPTVRVITGKYPAASERRTEHNRLPAFLAAAATAAAIGLLAGTLAAIYAPREPRQLESTRIPTADTPAVVPSPPPPPVVTEALAATMPVAKIAVRKTPRRRASVQRAKRLLAAKKLAATKRKLAAKKLALTKRKLAAKKLAAKKLAAKKRKLTAKKLALTKRKIAAKKIAAKKIAAKKIAAKKIAAKKLAAKKIAAKKIAAKKIAAKKIAAKKIAAKKSAAGAKRKDAAKSIPASRPLAQR